jgi:hypothetical protein
MFQANGFPSRVFACALALAMLAVIAERVNAQTGSQKSTQDRGRDKPDSVLQHDTERKSPSANKPDFARHLARPNGSMPMIKDWSNRHVIYTAGYTDQQAERMGRDPRAFASFVTHGMIRRHHYPKRPHPTSKNETLKRDWAVPLGAGGPGAGVFPAKFTFDVDAPPSCANDFVVFPVGGLTGASRASVLGRFTGDPTVGQTTSITITPAGSSPLTLTLTAGKTNAGTTFAVSDTDDITTDGTNLAAAINRNLSSIALDELAAVPSFGTLTVYALTAGTGVTLNVSNSLSNFSWGSVTEGMNGSKANIVGLNNLYSGSGSPLCTGYTYPTFTFSYDAGVGGIGSPVLSLDGQQIAFVEVDNTEENNPLEMVLHILTLGTGAEYGSCTNSGTAAPTCAIAPVNPGSTQSSNATDYMLPLGLTAVMSGLGNSGNIYPTTDQASAPFVDYSADVLYVGDDAGNLFSVSPVFGSGTPALRSGFPVAVEPGTPLSSPVLDATGDIFVEDATEQRLNKVTSDGVVDGYTTIGSNGGINGENGVVVDSTNGVGYAAASCNGPTGTYPSVVQFSTTGTGGPEVLSTATLNATGCPVWMFSPTLDNNYFARGISSSTPGNNGELLVTYGSNPGSLAQFQFTSGVMNTTAEYTDNDNGTFDGPGNVFTPITEFYGDDQAYTIGTVTQSGNTVTVTTGPNAFVSNQVVVISGLLPGTGGCTSSAVSAIDGEQNITVTSPTTFTFTSPESTIIGGVNGSCNLTSALTTGPTQDYLFFALSQSTLHEALTFDLPLTSATQGPVATNTTSVLNNTGGMIVDNDSSAGQASSIYFETSSSLSTCGSVACAVKLTQAGLN